jgi:hypothetical protein
MGLEVLVLVLVLVWDMHASRSLEGGWQQRKARWVYEEIIADDEALGCWCEVHAAAERKVCAKGVMGNGWSLLGVEVWCGCKQQLIGGE